MNTRKFAASAVALSMIVSMTGCSLLGGGKAKEEVISAADSFASNVCSLKASKIASAVADIDDDTTEALEFIADYISSDDVLSAIAGTLAYEIDEESVEVDSKKGEASVDVVFTYVDAQSVYDDVIDDGGDEDAFIDALGDCDDVVEVETTIEFVLEDDVWLVDDSELDCLEKVFGFFDYEFEFGSDFMDAYEGYSWFASDSDDTYTNATYINFWATYDYSLVTEEPDFYFTVEHDGELVFTSDTASTCDCYFYADQYTGDDYLPEGSYTVTLYLADGTYVDSGSTYVYNNAGSTYTGSVDSETYWADATSAWADTISLWGWYQDGSFVYESPSYSDGDYVEYDLGTDDTNAGSLYYAYYLTETGDISDCDLSNPVVDGTINYTAYNDGNFYECGLGYADAGVYLVIVADSESAWDNGDGEYLCYSMCAVS